MVNKPQPTNERLKKVKNLLQGVFSMQPSKIAARSTGINPAARWGLALLASCPPLAFCLVSLI
jgi:hypothetical protein